MQLLKLRALFERGYDMMRKKCKHSTAQLFFTEKSVDSVFLSLVTKACVLPTISRSPVVTGVRFARCQITSWSSPPPGESSRGKRWAKTQHGTTAKRRFSAKATSTMASVACRESVANWTDRFPLLDMIKIDVKHGHQK